MLTFLNGSMSVATQRFLTVELGKKDRGDYNRIFNMTMLIHFGLAVLILIVAETVDRKSTRLNSSHTDSSRMPSSA